MTREELFSTLAWLLCLDAQEVSDFLETRWAAGDIEACAARLRSIGTRRATEVRQLRESAGDRIRRMVADLLASKLVKTKAEAFLEVARQLQRSPDYVRTEFYRGGVKVTGVTSRNHT